MGKKVLVFLGHTNGQSFCGALADTYSEACRQAAAEVRMIRLSELNFNPALNLTAPQELEPDMARLQADILWANHIALVYPIWWGAAPGLMKCALERVLLTGFAFKYRSKGAGWDQLLQGRTCELLVTMDTPPTIYSWLFGAAGDRIMAHRTFGFCGIKCVRATHFGPIRNSSNEQRTKWLEKTKQLASKIT